MQRAYTAAACGHHIRPPHVAAAYKEKVLIRFRTLKNNKSPNQTHRYYRPAPIVPVVIRLFQLATYLHPTYSRRCAGGTGT